MASLKYSTEEYSSSYKNSGDTAMDFDSAHGTDTERVTSAFGSTPSSTSNLFGGTSTLAATETACATPASLTSDFVEYQTVPGSQAGGSLKSYKKVFTTTTTSTKKSKSSKSNAYGDDDFMDQVVPVASPPPSVRTTPAPSRSTPATPRSSSSMSKLEVHSSSSNTGACDHDHHGHGGHSHTHVTSGRSSGGDAGARIEYSYRREQTSSGGSGGGSRTVTPTASTRDSSASRKVKFSEKNQEIEIDNLPDPELDQDISLYTLEKKTTTKSRRIKMDDERFDYNDFAIIPPGVARSPLPHRKTDMRNRSPSPSIDPRAPSPIHQLCVPPPKSTMARTPSPGDKIETEHNCKYHSHHLDYKYTPPPVKGPCVACGQYIVGSLVTALDEMWHPECFCCVSCDTILKSHNYVVEDGKQYCKDCHLRLFGPPCNICQKPTKQNRYNLLNRIWHPECFCCVECGKRLTPDNFIERLGSPYCKEDYHRLFSPKCCVCMLPIKDKAINALNKMWHPGCFKCTHCATPLEERNFYEKNGLPYCEKCNSDLFNPKCWGCKKPITNGRPMMAMGKPWHPECFRCTVCVKPLTPDNFFEKDGKPYCEKDYNNLFAPKCAGCKNPIVDVQPVYNKGAYWHPDCDAILNRPPPPPPPVVKEVPKPAPPPPELHPINEMDIDSLLAPLVMAPPPPKHGPPCFGCKAPIDDDNYIKAMGQNYHPNCFKCTECVKPLNPYNFYEKDGKPYCEDDYHKLFSPKCAGCHDPIKDNNYIRAMGKDWHPGCFQCDACHIPLKPDNFYEMNGKPYCEDDYNRLFLPKCVECNKPIKGRPLNACGKLWHPECFKCHACKIPLSPDRFFEKDGWPYCEADYNKLFKPKCAGCAKPITGKPLRAMGKDWHPECFQCDKCHIPLSPDNFYEKNGKPYCEDDYHRLFSPKCCACAKPIKGKPLFVMGKEWHPECFKCSHPRCDRILSPDNYEEHDGKPYCKEHFQEMFLPKCFACKKPITDKVVSALGKTWHPECFACVQCNQPLDLNAFREKDGLPYCEADYHALFSPKCAACEAPIIDKCLTAINKTWHPEHFTCQHCNKIISEDPEGYHENDGSAYCRPCYIELFAPYCRGCNKPIVDRICVTALNSKYHTDCFVCRDCSCPLKDGNYFEFEGEPYCEEHFRCKMCPDCIKLRRAQNKYFGTMNAHQTQQAQLANGVPNTGSLKGPHSHGHVNPIRLGA